jgi:hypothetical protein
MAIAQRIHRRIRSSLKGVLNSSLAQLVDRNDLYSAF